MIEDKIQKITAKGYGLIIHAWGHKRPVNSILAQAWVPNRVEDTAIQVSGDNLLNLLDTILGAIDLANEDAVLEAYEQSRQEIV